jgi:NTE family protein
MGVWRIGRALYRNRGLLKRLNADKGLYEAEPLRKFLEEKVRKKLSYSSQLPLSFKKIWELTGKDLKVLAADVTNRRPVVFSRDTTPDFSVIDAVRASMCYPFVFRPVPYASSVLADGGLASNLPVFLFESERFANRHAQVIAFDLVSDDTTRQASRGLLQYAGDLLNTALDASEVLVRDLLDGVHYIPIKVDASIHAMDFKISRDRRIGLANAGTSQTLMYYNASPLSKARGSVEQVQARYGPPANYEAVLQAAALEFRIALGANASAIGGARVRVRTHIMLPVSSISRAVIYQFNMDSDPDIDLVLSNTAGCSGAACGSLAVAVADLKKARENPSAWGMTGPEANKVPADLCLMLSSPIFTASSSSFGDSTPIGAFSVDTNAQISENGWVVQDRMELEPTRDVEDLLDKWSGVIGHMLRGGG